MTNNTLIARAGRGLLSALVLLLRGAGALCAAVGSLFLLALSYYEPEKHSPTEEPRAVDGDEAKSYGWNSW